jgi:5-(carboxyamino)imidazole ribonucleotide synthase
VLGGGQLGRMFAHAAQQSGYRVAVLDPDETSPPARSPTSRCAPPTSIRPAWPGWPRSRRRLTTEFENVPAEALATLARSRPVAPGAEAVAVCQDRAAEKAAFERAGVACAPYAVLSSAADLDGVADALLPGILKTARLGYDGKGQRRVAGRAELARAWGELGGVTCVLEQRLALAAEISVIVARCAAGEIVALPVQENVHRDGILR